MITFRTNITALVAGMDRTRIAFKEAKIGAFKELTKIAFETQAETYFKDGRVKGKEYMPDVSGDISRYTRKKTLSVKPYFSSKVIISRSGETKQSLLDASKANALSYQNDDVGFEIDEKSIKVFATSPKFATIEKAKAGGGSKGARNTTKKTWGKVIRFFGKAFKKRFNIPK